MQSSILSVYLPPENSSTHVNACIFFEHLLTIIYLHTNADLMLICGDRNSRVSNKIDFIPEIDQLKEFIDTQTHSQGTAFIEFLKDSKFCIINGKVTLEFDNYTSISCHGKTVVDYI